MRLGVVGVLWWLNDSVWLPLDGLGGGMVWAEITCSLNTGLGDFLVKKVILLPDIYDELGFF